MIQKINCQKGFPNGIVRKLKSLKKIQFPSGKVLALTGAMALSGLSPAFASTNNQSVNDTLSKTEMLNNERGKCSKNGVWLGVGIASIITILLSALVALGNEDDLGTPRREGF